MVVLHQGGQLRTPCRRLTVVDDEKEENGERRKSRDKCVDGWARAQPWRAAEQNLA
jgi:hypothetical protein